MTEEEALAAGFRPNRGHCPSDLVGTDRRVEVILANGSVVDPTPIAQAVPGGWRADGRGGCRWTLTGSPFDIAYWRRMG